jgi:glycosyltransferase involved in cell wall biosynthesis
VTWFADTVLPRLLQRCPTLQFWIVGGKAAPAVRALGKRRGIRVTGRVPDVRPYLQHALASVAPMRIARGIQNKVLEAMAMGMPVLASAEALEGISAGSAKLAGLASTDDYLEALDSVLARGASPYRDANLRAFAESQHSWPAHLAAVEHELRQVPAASIDTDTRERDAKSVTA